MSARIDRIAAPRVARLLGVACAGLLLSAISCGEGGPSGSGRGGEAAAPAQDARDAAVSEVERGPVRAMLALEPGEPRLSDEPLLTLTVVADARVDVRLPLFGDSIGGFAVRGFEEPLPRLEGDRRILVQRYRLEPEDTGEHVIPPVSITFDDHRPEGDGATHEVELEELRVTVRSMLDAEVPRLTALAPPVLPDEIPLERDPPWAWIGGGAGALLLLILATSWWRRRARAARPQRVPTREELALAELERLLAADLLAKGDVQGFFVELTLVVRRYIERGTGLRAPERTTGEFLREMRSHPAFTPEERERLQAFLESADLVKFAAFRPAPEDVQESFRRAQEFCGLPGTLTLREGVAA